MTDWREANSNVWGATPAGSTHAEGLTPGTEEWFTQAARRRAESELPWLDAVAPFRAAAGKRVLEIGFGAGFDAFSFARNGADYSGVDLTPENLERAERHMSFVGESGEFVHGDALALPFKDRSFDVVYSFGVLHHVPDLSGALMEAHRVLRPGGQLWIAMYNRNSVFYLNMLFDHFRLGNWRHESITERRGRVEATTAGVSPHVDVYTRRQLSDAAGRAGFKVNRILTRKADRDDIPGRVGEMVPKRAWPLLSQWFGWYIIVEATK
jgi:SAM-dependent methyltransferase